MIRVLTFSIVVVAVGLVVAEEPKKLTTAAVVTAKITNAGRTIQLAQDGAFVNLLVVAEPSDPRRVTRIVSQPVDQYIFGIVVEMRHGDTDKYSYQLIAARRPRSEYELLRDSKTEEIRGPGPRFSNLSIKNPESDTVEVLLESDPKTDKELLAPKRYSNGCLRAWFSF